LAAAAKRLANLGAMYTQNFRPLAANLQEIYEGSAYSRHHAAKFIVTDSGPTVSDFITCLGVSIPSSANGVPAMKASLLVSAVLVGIAIGTHADAQNYPWCAFYGGRSGGGTNCGFTTFAQCMATVSGMGGYCARNTQYIPYVATPGPRRRRHYIHRHHPLTR
jgi:hypothetical protein